MIFTAVLFIFSIPLYILTTIAGLFSSVFPFWITTGIANILGGVGILNTIFPMFPHPGMPGLAGSIGIMTIFGSSVVLMGYLILLSLGYKLIKMILNQFSIGSSPSMGTGGR